MPRFRLAAPFAPRGDQGRCIEQLAAGVERGEAAQVLLGVTGSGKTFTVANLVERLQRPTLVVSHNKTLAAQLYSEFDLAALQKVGLVRERRAGSWVYHSIAPDAQADPFRAELLRLVARRLAGSPEALADEARLARRLALRDGDRCVVAVADFTTQAPTRVEGTLGRS